jgi:hypothetical protein
MRTRSTAPLFLLAAGLVVTLAEPAWAQSCGGSAGPPPAGCGAAEGSWLTKGKGSVRLSEEYEVKDDSYKGAHRVANDFDESLFISRTALDVRYGVTDDWTADVTATYPHFTYRLKPPGGERTKQRFRGPGDTFVSLGRQIVFGETPHHDAAMAPDIPGLPTLPEEPAHRPVFLSLWGGVSLPTGEAEKPNPAFVNSDVSVANLQTGTGTYDPFFRARAEWPQQGWTPFAEAAIRAPLYENRYRYQTADTEAIVVGADVPVVPKLTASLSTMWQRTGRDEFRGHNVGVGGARWIFLVPALAWDVTASTTLDVGVRVPVYRRTDTKLSDSSYILQAGLTWRF